MNTLTVARQRKALYESLHLLGLKLLSKDVRESTNDDLMKSYALICEREAIKQREFQILDLLQKMRLI